MSSRAAAVPHMAMASRSLPVAVRPLPLYISTPEANVQPVSPRLHLKPTCKRSEYAVVLVIYSSLFVRQGSQGFGQLTLWRVLPRWTLVWHVSAAAAAAAAAWLRAKGLDREVFQRAPTSAFPRFSSPPAWWFSTGRQQEKKGFTPTLGWPLVLWLTAVAAVTHRVCLPALVANFNSTSYLVPGHGCGNDTHWFCTIRMKWGGCVDTCDSQLKIPIGIQN